MQQQDKNNPVGSNNQPPKEEANSVANILAMVISILDWLKNLGKPENEFNCPDVCEVSQAIDRLRELTEKLAPGVGGKEKEDQITECEYKCVSSQDPSQFKPECKKCGFKSSKSDSENPSRKTVSIAEEPPPKEMKEVDDILKGDGAKKPEDEVYSCPDNCPNPNKALKDCDRCCQTAEDKQDDQKKKRGRRICACAGTQLSQAWVSTRASQPFVNTDEKTVQVQQYQILFEVRKAALGDVCVPDPQKFRSSNLTAQQTIQEVYKSLEPISTASEDETAEEDDDDTFYECTRPQSPQRSLIPTRQVVQPPNPPLYRTYYPQYISSGPYQQSKIPQRYPGYRGGYSYHSYRPYQGLRYPMVSEGIRPTSSARPNIPLYGAPIKSTLNEYVSPESTSPPIPSGQQYSPPADCARRLIEAIMRNPTCPAFEALKKATGPSETAPQETANYLEDANVVGNADDNVKDEGICDPACLGSPKKKSGTQ